MTESQWLTCTDPTPMLEFLADRSSNRKRRLFGVACCRRALNLLHDQRSRDAVEVAERYADGAANEEELRNAFQYASEAAGLGDFGGDDSWGQDSFAAGTEGPAKAAAWAATWDDGGSIELSNAAATAAVLTWHERPGEFLVQAGLLRCIFGNPFRSPTLHTSLLNDFVIKLATTIYEERAWDRLPILADALQECGVAAEALNHCRQPGVHARGCFALDLILNKA